MPYSSTILQSMRRVGYNQRLQEVVAGEVEEAEAEVVGEEVEVEVAGVDDEINEWT